MKRILIALTLVCLLTAGPALAEAGSVGMPNPWVETDAEGAELIAGVRLGIPEGAEDVAYTVLEEEKLVQMTFTWYGMEYTARVKPAVEFEDISGLYYESWDSELPCQIGWCEGVDRRVREGELTINQCLWFDAVPGIMYSVVTGGPDDLDGFDIQAAAEQLFLPLQGDAEGE